jgi:hypothetical protein
LSNGTHNQWRHTMRATVTLQQNLKALTTLSESPLNVLCLYYSFLNIICSRRKVVENCLPHLLEQTWKIEKSEKYYGLWHPLNTTNKWFIMVIKYILQGLLYCFWVVKFKLNLSLPRVISFHFVTSYCWHST